MRIADASPALTRIFCELVDGVTSSAGGSVLNSGDAGLLRSLARLSAAEASRSVHGGATIAAHAQHLRYGLSLMNRWAEDGGDPFADPAWDQAWTTTSVDPAAWDEIRKGLWDQARRWRQALQSPRDITDADLAGLIASIAHVAYHLGAIRQIDRHARGPREGTFSGAPSRPT